MQLKQISFINLGLTYVEVYFLLNITWLLLINTLTMSFDFFLRAGLTLYASHKFGEYSQKQSCLFPSCPLVYFWSSWYPCSPERKKHIHVYYTSTNISTHRINHMHYCRAFINFPMARILLPTKISPAISGTRRWIVVQTEYSWSY